MKNGSYLGYRKIQMLLEVWDRSSLMDQEDTFGRHKHSGAPYGKKKEHDKVNPAKLPTDATYAWRRTRSNRCTAVLILILLV